MFRLHTPKLWGAAEVIGQLWDRIQVRAGYRAHSRLMAARSHVTRCHTHAQPGARVCRGDLRPGGARQQREMPVPTSDGTPTTSTLERAMLASAFKCRPTTRSRECARTRHAGSGVAPIKPRRLLGMSNLQPVALATIARRGPTTKTCTGLAMSIRQPCEISPVECPRTMLC
jgi:hypothetical protein